MEDERTNQQSLILERKIDILCDYPEVLLWCPPNRTTYIPYFLAPPYSEAGLAHCLCESPLDATDPKPSSDRLEHGEARQYCSTLVRSWSMQDSIEPSHLVVKATADIILNPEGYMTSNNNNRYKPKTNSTSSIQERTRNRQHLGRKRRSGPRLVMVVPHL